MGGVDLSVSAVFTMMFYGSPRPCGRGGFKRIINRSGDGELRVPARVGGVDLSCRSFRDFILSRRPRPCGRGGFKQDLSCRGAAGGRPRPCGRGGFKPLVSATNFPLPSPRPCGRGGFKLSPILKSPPGLLVPARVGGVDLSLGSLRDCVIICCPRPCGRGGFKPSCALNRTECYSPHPCGRGGFKPHYVVQRRFQHCLCHLGCNFDTFSYAIFI